MKIVTIKTLLRLEYIDQSSHQPHIVNMQNGRWEIKKPQLRCPCGVLQKTVLNESHKKQKNTSHPPIKK